MLDRNCYDRMSEALLEGTIEAMKEEGIYAEVVDAKTLGELEKFLEEHEYAAYWDGFKEMAMNQHLARWYIFQASTDAIKGLFRKFEDYVVEQLKKE